MKITILAIGKKHDTTLSAAILEYTNRFQHYAKCEWKLVEAKITSSMDESKIRNTESEVLGSHINANDFVILLDERGKQLSSTDLASNFQTYMNSGMKNMVVVIGGAYGVNEDLMKRANYIWSLSELVFPHQLVRLILIEQLYRAHTILAGEKYHHQ